MAQFVYTMHRVGKVVPPKRHILKNISLSFFPGAKIGVLGLNGAGKSTLLRIMAGIDTEIEGEARPQPGIKIGYLPQEPQLNPEHTVRESVEEAVAEVVNALKGLDEVYAKYAEPDADFDKLAAQQGKFEEIIQAHDGHNLNVQLERAADALRLPDWDAKIANLSGGERRRVALCRLLLEKPDMLLLDEPTNHLDAESVAWLERFLGTYAGNPLAVAAAHAVLDVIAEEQLCQRAEQLGSHLQEVLNQARATCPAIVDVRGRGSMVAVEFNDPQTGEPSPEFTRQVQQKAQENGLLLLSCGVYGNVIRFLYPLTIPDAQFSKALDILARVLKS